MAAEWNTQRPGLRHPLKINDLEEQTGLAPLGGLAPRTRIGLARGLPSQTASTPWLRLQPRRWLICNAPRLPWSHPSPMRRPPANTPSPGTGLVQSWLQPRLLVLALPLARLQTALQTVARRWPRPWLHSMPVPTDTPSQPLPPSHEVPTQLPVQPVTPPSAIPTPT